MSIIANIKKRKNSTTFMREQIDKLNTKKAGVKDARIWKPKVGDTGTSSFLIRFLPSAEESKAALIKRFDHHINGSGRYYSTVCPTSFGKPCPICEQNRDLWKDEATKTLASQRKRREKYFANILILEDKLTPENVGKVFVYEFGAQIFGKIEGMYNPQYEDQNPVDPFDLFEGAGFRVRANNTKKKIGANKIMEYDESAFISPAPLYGGDEKKLEEVMKQIHDLSDFDGSKELQTYEEIEARFLEVTAKRVSASSKKDDKVDDNEEDRRDDETSASSEDSNEVDSSDNTVEQNDLNEDELLESLGA